MGGSVCLLLRTKSEYMGFGVAQYVGGLGCVIYIVVREPALDGRPRINLR